MSLRQVVWLVLAVVVLLVAASGVLIGVEASRERGAQNQLQSRFDPAVQLSQTLLLDYVNMETGYRGYLLTEQSSYLKPYQDGAGDAMLDTARLRSLFGGEGQLERPLVSVMAAASIWTRQVASTLALAQAGDRATAIALVRSTDAKAAFDSLRATLTTLQSAVDHRRNQADSEQRQAATLLEVVLVVTSAAAFVGLAILALATWRWVVRPIRELGEASNRVREGALDVPVRLGSGPPEFLRLAADVDSMRTRLVALVRLAGQAGDTAVESRVATVRARQDTLRANEALVQGEPLVADVRDALQPSDIVPPGLDVYGFVASAEGQIAGDWWDVVELPDGRCALLVADVSGHGAQAGLLAVRLKAVLTLGLRLGHDTARLIAIAAADVFSQRADMFASAIVVIVDRRAGSLSWSSAGHPAATVIRADGTRVELDQTGPIIHRMFTTWGARTITFADGDLLVAFTDGLVEARDAAGVGFDLEGTLASLVAREGARRCVDVMLDALIGHTGQPRDDDDVTIVVARAIPLSPPPLTPSSS